MKILIADKMSDIAETVFQANSQKEQSLEVDKKTELSSAELTQIIPDYDALIVRSATKVTKEIISAGKKLKIIGRAGIGIDNIDIKAATAHGIVVMNAPLGNSITTAEHALSLLFSLARQIPYADRTMRAGHWKKSSIKGVEIHGKTLGIIGCGNIGSIVANKAIGYGMNVLAFDPYLTEENAQRIGVQTLSFAELLSKAEFLTCHVPLNDKTYHIIDEAAMLKMKKGVYIVNCSRGGIVDEEALAQYLNSDYIAGAALDVFEKEPLPEDSSLLTAKNIILTPHLGGSTIEAQEKVVKEIAQQISSFLLQGAISNAVNTVSLSAKESRDLAPYLTLVEQMSAFIGQIIESGIVKIVIEYCGKAVEVPTKMLTHSILRGILAPIISDINVINAQIKAHERGIHIDCRNIDKILEYQTLVRLRVQTEKSEYSIAGTLFGSFPRIVKIKEIAVEADLGKYNLYVINWDLPGFIKQITQILAEANINIASFHLGRKKKGGEAVSIIVCDEAVSPDILAQIQAIEMVKFCKFIQL